MRLRGAKLLFDYRLEDSGPPFVALPELDEEKYYYLAVQVLDADGVPSLEQDYAQEVLNFRVSSTMYRPLILVREWYLGELGHLSQTEIASGQPLNFLVRADAHPYGARIASMRYGWDVMDPNDPNDPGWMPPTGFGEEIIRVPERVFQDGWHSLTVRAEDELGFDNLVQVQLLVIPFLDPQDQRPLLFIDQVVDNNSNAWPDETGTIAYDNAQYRDAFWRHLEQENVVVGFDWEQDRFDELSTPSYSDLVQYRSVLISARMNPMQTLFNQFRPVDGQDPYVWLAPYQARGGNLFLAGESSMESFLPIEPNYMTPVIFDTWEDEAQFGHYFFVVGFGATELPDGEVVKRGTMMYPYLTAGIDVLDWASPAGKHLFGRPFNQGADDRKPRCVGLKAMVLNADFRSRHQIGSAVLPDTLWTDPAIDWFDGTISGDTLLQAFYPFGSDEFYDAVINARPTPWYRQNCADGPDGYCVEPMFEGVARLDWMREREWSSGNTGWPYNAHSLEYMADVCGARALTDYQGPGGAFMQNASSRTNGLTYGFLSYKNVENKPSGKADAYWGFDPYRMDHAGSKAAIRWVLEYFGIETGP